MNLITHITQLVEKNLFRVALIFVTLIILSHLSIARASLNLCEGLFKEFSFSTLNYAGKLDHLNRLTKEEALTFIETYGTNRNINFDSNTLDGSLLRKTTETSDYYFSTYKIRGKNSILRVHKVMDKPATVSLPDAQSAHLFARRVAGNLLGAFSNGPLLIEFGILVDQVGKKYFFTIAQEIHPGEIKTSLKDNAENPENNYTHSRSLMSQFFNKNSDTILNLATDILIKLERGIHMNDPNFSLSARGKIKWIDTDFWKLRPRTPDSITNQHNILYVIVAMLKKANSNVALSFITQLQMLVQNSAILEKYEKNYYRSTLLDFEREIRNKKAVSH